MKRHIYRKVKWRARKGSFLLLFAVLASAVSYNAIGKTNKVLMADDGVQYAERSHSLVYKADDTTTFVDQLSELEPAAGQESDIGGYTLLESVIEDETVNNETLPVPRRPQMQSLKTYASEFAEQDDPVDAMDNTESGDVVFTEDTVMQNTDREEVMVDELLNDDASETTVVNDEYIHKENAQESILDTLGDRYADIPEIPSLLFFPRQMALIKEFELGLIAPLPEDRRIADEKNPIMAPKTKNAIRELYLSGILYSNETNWIIWLNGKRITPEDHLKEIFDLSVQKEYVELVWHDLNTNIVYPIRLRPNQRFNLDSRLFLPG